MRNEYPHSNEPFSFFFFLLQLHDRVPEEQVPTFLFDTRIWWTVKALIRGLMLTLQPVNSI